MAVTAVFPKSFQVRFLHARLLRSGRRFPEALATCQAALALASGLWRGAVLLEQGRALRAAGQRTAAIDSFVAAWHAGERNAAIQALCRYGARGKLPEAVPGIAPLGDYPEFAAANSIPPAPPAIRKIVFRILIDGAEQDRAKTYASVAAQSHQHWVLSGGDASMVDLALMAGTLLHPEALAWLAWAIAETGARVVKADHDLLGADGVIPIAPVLLTSEDRLWPSADEAARIVARLDSATGPTLHVPLVLASCPSEPKPGLPVREDARRPADISVIIPTRDNPDLLRTAIATLRATALAPERIDLVIVDNGSRTPEGRALLTELADQPRVTIVSFDAPFNWSRANTLGAAAADGDLLLFLNDDTEMWTYGWDGALAGLLADPATGVVGARMLYPDATIQHGGFVFGMDNGPQHEGRWMTVDNAGPGGRWLATRQAAAVTGAFMAVRRTTYDALNGFDAATFAVDFADVDFCMRLRSHGLAVVYCGGITLLHHESVSRGLNLSRAKRRRMRRETAALRARWGAAVDYDPGYHPAWVRTGCSYDGLRSLTQNEVIDYVRRDSEGNRWIIHPV